MLNHEAIRIYANMVFSIEKNTRCLKAHEEKRKSVLPILIDRLNKIRILAKKIADESEAEEFERVFSLCSEAIRRIIDSVSFASNNVEQARQDCSEWVNNHAKLIEG